MQSIYMIMVCTKLRLDSTGIPDFGSTKLVGYFHDREEATQTVLLNKYNINESFYKYAIIEKVNEGVYPSSIVRSFYVFDNELNTYRKLAEPPFLVGYAGLII